MTDRPANDHRGRGKSAAAPSPAFSDLATLAAGLGLTLGILDTLLGFAETGLVTFRPPFLSLVTLAVFAGCLLGWYVALRPLARLLRLRPMPLAWAIVPSGLGVLAGVAVLGWRRAPSAEEVGIALSAAPLVTAVSYAALRNLSVAPPHAGQALASGLVAAELLGAAVVLGGSNAVWARLLVVVLTPVALAMTAGFLARRRHPSAKRVLLAVLFAVAVLLPSFGALGERAPAPGVVLPGEAGCSASPDAPEHVFLIVLDTFRHDVLSCRSPDAPPTPALDALARQSTVYTEARAAAPWTLPSMCSLMTGESPLVHRATSSESVLPDGLRTLAERMSAAGYRTAAFGENRFLLRRSKLDRGFQHYTFFPKLVSRPPLGTVIVRAVAPLSVARRLPAHRLNGLALEWVARHRDERCFVWLHYFDVHLPYAPPVDLLPDVEPPRELGSRWSELAAVRQGVFVPDSDERAWIEGLYRAEVRFLDAEIGRLLERLRELGIYDDALIVLTSDHGEEFWEHDGFEHGHSVHDEVIRVPLIIKQPGQTDGIEIDGPVSIEAVASTILEACGIPHAAAWPTAASLFDSSGAPRRAGGETPLLSTGTVYYEDRTALVSEGMKLIRMATSGREALYDLARDPEERRPIAPAGAADLVEAMRHRLRVVEEAARQRRDALGLGEGERREIDESLRRELRSLGYVN